MKTPTSRKLKVLHIEVGGSYGGSVRALEKLLEYMPSSDFQQDLALYFPTAHVGTLRSMVGQLFVLRPFAATTAMGANSRNAVGKSQRIRRAAGRLRGGCAIITSLPILYEIARLIRSREYDVVHVNNTFNYQPASIWAAKWARRPVVAHARNPVAPTTLARSLARSLSGLISINSILAVELKAQGIRVPISVIPGGVDPVQPAREELTRTRNQFVKPDELLLASVGRLTEQKGFEFLIRASQKVVARFPNVKLVIVGEGPLRSHLQQLTERLGLRDHVLFAGFRSDMNVTAACDIFVCSSLWEGGPLTVCEALALGRPVVSTHVGIVPELLLDQSAGLVVPPSDPDALANAVSTVVRMDASGRAEMGARGRAAARAVTDCEGLAAEFSDVLKRAV